MNSRLIGISVATASTLAFAGTAAAPAPAARAHASCRYHASFHAPNHHPKVNRNWVVRVRVRPSHLRTKMHYEFWFSGRKVATRYVRNHKNYSFKGHMSDAVVWPKRAIGIPIQLRVVLHNRCGTKTWKWAVKAHK